MGDLGVGQTDMQPGTMVAGTCLMCHGHQDPGTSRKDFLLLVVLGREAAHAWMCSPHGHPRSIWVSEKSHERAGSQGLKGFWELEGKVKGFC